MIAAKVRRRLFAEMFLPIRQLVQSKAAVDVQHP